MDNLLETLLCPVCFETFKYPLLCSQGHTVCGNCYLKMQMCPICMIPYREKEPIHNSLMRNITSIMHNDKLSEIDRLKEVTLYLKCDRCSSYFNEKIYVCLNASLCEICARPLYLRNINVESFLQSYRFMYSNYLEKTLDKKEVVKKKPRQRKIYIKTRSSVRLREKKEKELTKK